MYLDLFVVGIRLCTYLYEVIFAFSHFECKNSALLFIVVSVEIRIMIFIQYDTYITFDNFSINIFYQVLLYMKFVKHPSKWNMKGLVDKQTITS